MQRAHWSLTGVALLAALCAAGAREGMADGAIAVGSTGDVVKFGIAFGMVVDLPKEKAAEAALNYCRAFKGATAEANGKCVVVATFSRHCFAVAIDPQPATPGAGWGVGEDQIVANEKAMTMCENTAGAARKAFCQIKSGACDKKN